MRSESSAARVAQTARTEEYVKVCSLYGAGYYYMPGTDICIKVGGYIRFQTTFGTSQQTRPHITAVGSRTNEAGAQYGWRTRADLTIDTRQQTAWGTLRTYMVVGHQQDNGGGAALRATRGFIQIAGFTFGKATSFFDHFPTAGRAYFAGNFHNSSTGDGGWNVAAYTAQFGNGLSATIALEEARNNPVAEVGGAGATPVVFTDRSLHGTLRGYPDIVANLRVDQAWGSAMIAGALHDASASYYGGLVNAGHPGSKMGWAITGALQLNVPLGARGSVFNVQGIYSEGAVRYASHTSATGGFTYVSGNTIGFGAFTDGVFAGPAGGINLTTAWSIAAAYQHQWTPNLNTSFYGSYLDVSYNGAARNIICTAAGVAIVNCNPDWSAWNLGARTEWEPVRGLTFGVDVVYNRLDTSIFHNAAGTTAVLTTPGAGYPAGTYRMEDQDSFVGMFRVQRNFLP
jgi:hypothetical protein